MSSENGIQFIGIDSVLDVYDDYDQEGYTWALFQGTRLTVPGSGSEELEKWLRRFEPSGSNSSYTLSVYKGILPEQINKNSYPVASFRFKLIDQYAGQGITGMNNQLWQRVASLEKKLSGDGDSEDKTLTGQLLGIFDDPAKIDATVGAITQIISAIKGKMIGAMPVTPGQSAQPSGDTLEQVAQSLDILERHDPLLSQHLQKLAQLAQSDPLIFKGVISKLDAL